MSTAPKVIKLDNVGIASTSSIRFTPIAPKLPTCGIVPPPPLRIKELPPKPKGPDIYMLSKPAPIPFNLPKEASLIPRNVKEDPMNDPPQVALNKLEGEARNLKEEVAALKWLAKRKEQEWNRYEENIVFDNFQCFQRSRKNLIGNRHNLGKNGYL